MKLVPIRPPGPNARKARAFAAEIWQLRAQGYTFEAIREALAAVGVNVSNSTVQREVARATKHQALAAPAAASDSNDRPLPPSMVSVAPASLTTSQCTSTPADFRSGREVAEAYTRNLSTNPLIRSKQKR